MAQASRNGTELVHVGFGNFLSVNKVLAIVTPTSAPIQRMIREGKKEKHIIDITSGRRTKAAVFMDSGPITARGPGMRAEGPALYRHGPILSSRAPSSRRLRWSRPGPP